MFYFANNVPVVWMVRALVAQNYVDFLDAAGAANIRTEHDVVRGVTMEVVQIDIRSHHLK